MDIHNLTHNELPQGAEPRKKPHGVMGFLLLLLLIACVVIGSFYIVGRPPSNFISGTSVVIPPNASTDTAGSILESAHVIRSKNVFDFMVSMVFGNKPVITGNFKFDTPTDILGVVEMLTGGSFGGTEVKITIPEGSSGVEIAAIIKKQIPTWDTKTFITNAKPLEGYLFPNTYLVFKTTTPVEMIDLLKNEYTKKITPIKSEMQQSGHSESDIIIMASLLEKEARNADEAKVISGILWKRISNGQPLQVDAPFLYVLGKSSSELTINDLQKDGPYNTYTRKGLPVGPIGNPGIAMIEAAIHPISSPYLYYLHDNKGVVHYAKTYTEHMANVQKYLR